MTISVYPKQQQSKDQFPSGQLILRYLILINALIILSYHQVYASAVVEQRQRAIQQRQQQIRAKQLEVIQKQQQAYKQQLIQRQQAAYKHALQQRAAQQKAYNQAVQKKVQEVYKQRAINIQDAQAQAAAQMQAQKQAYQQAMQQTGVLVSEQMQQIPQPQINVQQVQSSPYGNTFYTPPVEEVVNITDIWRQMEDNSRSWNLMIDMEPKILTVQRMIDYFRDNGIIIQKPASHYVQLIDSMAFQNPELLNQPFENIMKVVAIIEYDFDNGQDKDALARQVFPDDKQFNANKKRLGF